MDSHQNYSDITAFVFPKIKNRKFRVDNIFFCICDILEFIEEFPECKEIIDFENINFVLEQLIILIFEKNKTPIDLYQIRAILREALILYKNTTLMDNLNNSRRHRRCCPVLF